MAHTTVRLIGTAVLIWLLPALCVAAEYTGSGPTREQAVRNAVTRAVVDHVTPVFVRAEQARVFVGLHPELLQPGAGLVKSVGQASCQAKDNAFQCSLDVEMSDDPQAATNAVARLAGPSTFSVRIFEYVGSTPVADMSLARSIANAMVAAGYVAVRPSFPARLSITGRAVAEKVPTQRSGSFVLLRLRTLDIRVEQPEGADLLAFGEDQVQSCMGGGREWREAADKLFDCLCQDLGERFVSALEEAAARQAAQAPMPGWR